MTASVVELLQHSSTDRKREKKMITLTDIIVIEILSNIKQASELPRHYIHILESLAGLTGALL